MVGSSRQIQIELATSTNQNSIRTSRTGTAARHRKGKRIRTFCDSKLRHEAKENNLYLLKITAHLNRYREFPSTRSTRGSFGSITHHLLWHRRGTCLLRNTASKAISSLTEKPQVPTTAVSGTESHENLWRRPQVLPRSKKFFGRSTTAFPVFKFSFRCVFFELFVFVYHIHATLSSEVSSLLHALCCAVIFCQSSCAAPMTASPSNKTQKDTFISRLSLDSYHVRVFYTAIGDSACLSCHDDAVTVPCSRHCFRLFVKFRHFNARIRVDIFFNDGYLAKMPFLAPKRYTYNFTHLLLLFIGSRFSP